VILFFFLFAQDLFCFLRRGDFPPIAPAMKIISMEKKKNGVFRFWVLIKFFWQDDGEPFLLTQHVRKERLISNQILKPLRGFRRKEVGKFCIFRATRVVSAEGFCRPYNAEHCTEQKPFPNFHQTQYISKEASLQSLTQAVNHIEFAESPELFSSKKLTYLFKVYTL